MENIYLHIWKTPGLVKSSVSYTVDGSDNYGFVTLYSAQGPTDLTWSAKGYSKVVVQLEDDSGDSVLVYLRGQRKTACGTYTMNSAATCTSLNKYSQLILSFHPEDNENLVYNNAGNYTGAIPLQAKRWQSAVTEDIVAMVTLRDLISDPAF